MTGITTIFWDNDGVLVDTEPLYYQATREILAELGLEFTAEQYRQFVLVQNIGAFHLAELQGMNEEAIAELRRRRNARYAELLRVTPTLIDGAAATLRALAGTYRMGIVTSSWREHFEISHKASGLLQYIDFVLTGNDFTRSKPDPEPYLKAIARSGSRPEECLVVEDSERGLLAATRAGLRCVVIPRDMTRDSDFRNAYRVLHDITELPPLLAKR